MRRRYNTLALTLAALIGGLAVAPASAHHLLPQHDLECSADFPCPPELRPRVSFWVEVFRSWGKETAVLHDPARPQRVYAVFNTGQGCSRAVRSQVKRKRDQVRRSLRAIAAKIEAGDSISGADERHLAALFRSAKPGEIRAAADNIRCQSGVRDSFLRGLKGYERYRPMVEDILAENNLPEEIRYLPFVESSYNPAAYSKAGAAGMWQIMPKTARVLGLELNATLDERLDPEAATRAAAEYLKRSERRLGAVARERRPEITRAQLNPFIITSYNYGVNGMRRAIHQVGPDFMQVLERYKSPSFQIAVKNFYASFLAARHVAVNAERYFDARPAVAVAQYQTVVLQQPASIATITSVFGLSEAQLRPLNRALTRFVWQGWRLIPAGYRLRLPARQDRWRAQRAKLASLGAESVIAGGDRYTVRRGDTACAIARAVKVNCSEFIRLNQLGRKAVIRVGQTLVIPGQPAATAAARTYRVRRGDSACAIAGRFGVDCRTLIGLNRLGRTALIHPGQMLSIPPTQTPGGLNADNQYIVRRGDSACRIAVRFSVHCEALRELNRLDRKAVIHPGQKLKIPGLVVPDTSETAQQLARGTEPAAAPGGQASAAQVNATAATDQTTGATADTLRNLLDTLPDLGIRVTDAAGEAVYTIRVEAEETLGHFADWLGIGSAGALRNLNQLRYGRALVIGQRLRLPVKNARMAQRFEQHRTDYHQVLSESLKEHYNLAGVASYTVKKGDSPWSLSNRLGFPVWLLYRLNPVLHSAQLQAGQMLVLPKLSERS